jgi:hypothetical protein
MRGHRLDKTLCPNQRRYPEGQKPISEARGRMTGKFAPSHPIPTIDRVDRPNPQRREKKVEISVLEGFLHSSMINLFINALSILYSLIFRFCCCYIQILIYFLFHNVSDFIFRICFPQENMYLVYFPCFIFVVKLTHTTSPRKAPS